MATTNERRMGVRLEKAKRGRGDEGISVILFALSAVLLLTLAALVLDLGNGRQEKRKLQNAADAAALAAARDLNVPGSKFCNTAVNYLRNNLRLAPLGTTTACNTTSTDTGAKLKTTVTWPVSVGSYNQNFVIRVKACRDVDTFFASIIGVGSVEVCAQATAKNTFSETIDDDGETGVGGCKDAKKDTCGVTPPINWQKNCDPATNAPVVDGRAPLTGKGTPNYKLQTSEGYKRIGDLGVGGVDLGDMLFSCDADSYYFGMTFNALSTGNVANENVYGLGTYHQTYATGWLSGGLGTRVNSEHAIFEFRCGANGAVISHFKQQYVDEGMPKDGGAVIHSTADVDAGPTPVTSTSFVWNWNNAATTGWSQANAALSSPPFDAKYPTPSVTYENWEWPMSYEFKLPRSAFDSCVDADPIIQVITIHNSPGKTSEFTNVFGQATVGVALVE